VVAYTLTVAELIDAEEEIDEVLKGINARYT
jgi:hypothetical protein